jgi:predicted transcriptional regulator
MSDSRRQTAPNLAEILDKKRQYMNDRLSALAGLGLVQRVGPSDRSGMYEITLKGLLVLQEEDQYSHSSAHEFSNRIENQLSGEANRRRERLLSAVSKGALVDYGELRDSTGFKQETLEETLEDAKTLHLISETDGRSYRMTALGNLILESITNTRSELRGYS